MNQTSMVPGLTDLIVEWEKDNKELKQASPHMHWSGWARLCYVDEQPPNLNGFIPAKLSSPHSSSSLNASLQEGSAYLCHSENQTDRDFTLTCALNNLHICKSHSDLEVSVQKWLGSLLLMSHYATSHGPI